MTTSRKSLAIAVTLLAICFVALNMTARLTLGNVKMDLTEGKIFTLSDEAADIASQGDEDIVLRFFYSNSLLNGFPTLKSYAERIISTLRAYEKASDGHITVQIIDPKPFTEDEDLAVSYGLKAVPLDNKGTEIYFGLIANNSIDETRSIPVFHFQRETFIEYDLGRIIVDLSQENRQTIGVLSSLPMDAPGLMGVPGLGGGKSWIFLEQIRQNFIVKRIEEDTTEISPDEFAAILIAQPKEMPDTMLYALEQYAFKGGRMALFLDPNAEGKGGNSGDDNSFHPGMNKLLEHWGIRVTPDQFAADRYAARKVHNKDIPGTHIDYLGWQELRGDRIIKNDPVTAMLNVINVASPGAILQLEHAEDALTFAPLLQTEPNADLMPTSLLKGKPDPKKLLQQFSSDDIRYTLAARLTGYADTMFNAKKDTQGHQSSSAHPLNIVVVADTDFLKDESWARAQDFEGKRVILPMADNGNFAVNILDHLAGSDALVHLRGKGTHNRPFDVVQKLKKDAETRYLEEEQRLKDKLSDTEARLASLQQQAGESGGVMYQAEQQSEIKRFAFEAQQLKRNLRKVSHKLREEIDALGGKLKILNIWGVPLILVVIALFTARRRVISSGRKRISSTA